MQKRERNLLEKHSKTFAVFNAKLVYRKFISNAQFSWLWNFLSFSRNHRLWEWYASPSVVFYWWCKRKRERKEHWQNFQKADHNAEPSAISWIGRKWSRRGGGERERERKKENEGVRTSLVAQWLRIRLPMQGTRVWSLVQEVPTCHGGTKPVHHNYWACALEPMHHNYWSPRATTTEPMHCNYWCPRA